jgi:hypothetical protein
VQAAWVLAGVAPALLAQQKGAGKPFQAQSPSSIDFGPNKEGYPIIEITKRRLRRGGPAIPGRPQTEQLVMRLNTRTKHEVDAIGHGDVDNRGSLAAGSGSQAKASLHAEGGGNRCENGDNDLLVLSRGLEEVVW